MGKEDTYDYAYLLKEYKLEHICNKFQFWYNEMMRFIKAAGLEKKLRIDRRKLGYAVLSYYADIYRLKEFHDIEKTNLPKVYGYEAFWILRMSPLQLVDTVQDDLLWINEKFVVTVLISRLLRCVGLEGSNFKVYPSIKEFADLLYYSFKYRTCSSQMLELAIKGFMAGANIRG